MLESFPTPKLFLQGELATGYLRRGPGDWWEKMEVTGTASPLPQRGRQGELGGEGRPEPALTRPMP